MQYLVDAYNVGDEASIRHITTPDSREQFLAERQWVKSFRFEQCTPNGAPTWDYVCVLRIVEQMPGVAPTDSAETPLMDDVTVLVGAAARPGFYLEANMGCGGG